MSITIDEFDALPVAEARELLHPICASGQWVSAVAAGRPFRTLDALLAASDGAQHELPWTEVEDALAAHPRIGERPTGTSTESAFSRQEQSAATSDAGVDEALRAGNAAYEERFGRVFLVCATGLSRREVLDRLTVRLGGDDDTERQVTRDELAAIVRLRLTRTMG